MLALNDTDYYNVQGTMLIDPVITEDVSLVESKCAKPPRQADKQTAEKEKKRKEKEED